MIDVHGHFLTDEYSDALASAGLLTVDGYPMPKWSADGAIAMMDRFGIKTSIVSISSPGIHFLSGGAAARLARSINEAARRLIDAYPARFGAFAVVPMDDLDAARREIDHALDVLKLDGVGLFTNYNGAYLGDSRFDAIFNELNRRGAVAFVHPTAPPAFDRIGLDFSAPLMEYLFDTTRMIANLLASGTLSRCRNLKMIVSHGGGALPFIAPRVSRILALLPPDSSRRSSAHRPVDAQAYRADMQRLFYDVTSICHPAALKALGELVPASQILAGFDYPFIPSDGVGVSRDALLAFYDKDAEELAAIASGNARRLFKRFTA